MLNKAVLIATIGYENFNNLVYNGFFVDYHNCGSSDTLFEFG